MDRKLFIQDVRISASPPKYAINFVTSMPVRSSKHCNVSPLKTFQCNEVVFLSVGQLVFGIWPSGSLIDISQTTWTDIDPSL